MAATNKVISLVIVVVRKEEGYEHGVQRPVYYINEVLTESKQRYPHFQKLAYGVFLGSRKLRHYFQEHPITVVSKAPLATILNNADATGRTAKWGIEVNPEKIKAILCIKRPTCLKDVQRLTGCVAAISRFVSRLGEKALPLYKLLKKTDKFF
jgi:hypothetical protein